MKPGGIAAKTLVGALATLAALGAGSPGAAAEPLRVLFIGNSLTFYNDLPTMVERMAAAAGVERPLAAERIVRGGETFERHVARTDAGAPLKVLKERGWDWVVLQENGRFAASGDASTLPSARRLVKAAREAGAEPIFYMTWAYRDRPETLGKVHRTYFLLASELEAPVAPVGEAWRLARERFPRIELFDPDGVHPSAEGTYLAACLIFSELYGRSPVAIPLETPGGQKVAAIEASVARSLQQVAADTLRVYPQPADP